MATPIRAKETIIAGLRPERSAKRPMTNPPSGRVTKPAPKVARVNNRPCEVRAAGKKQWPIWMAKKEKVRKS